MVGSPESGHSSGQNRPCPSERLSVLAPQSGANEDVERTADGATGSAKKVPVLAEP